MKKSNAKSFAVLLAAAATIVLIIAIGKAVFTAPTATDNGSTYYSETTGNEKYEKIQKTQDDIHKGSLILVNSDNMYAFSENLDLVSIYDNKSKNYNVKDKNVSVSKQIMEPLNQMLDDFYKEYKNSSINIISGHRTYDFQETLLKEKIETDGAVEASKWVAFPGASEHHTGLAVDFSIYNSADGTSASYDGKGDYQWINDNAYKYGFIVRYAEEKKDITGIYYEPWHFRYIGLPHSYLVRSKNMCYEEYIDFLRQYKFDEKHLTVEFGGKTYEIYFTDSTDVYVPKNSSYTISGNNIDGFIVTVVK